MVFLKSFLKNDFLKNIILGILIRFISFVFPYVFTTPYLIRVLDDGQFGLTTFSVGLVALFYPFVEYGFNLTAPSDISMNLNDKKKVGAILSNILYSKLFLLTICIVVLMSVIYYHPDLHKEYTLHLFSITLIVGQALSPVWFYQGINQLKKFAVYNLFINVSILTITFIFIKQPSDYFLTTLIQGCIWIIGYSIALGLGVKPYLSFISFDMKNVIKSLKKGFFIFTTNLLNFVFVTANIIILGFFVTGKPLDDYSYTEKIYMIVRIILGVIYQMAYPKTIALKMESEEKATIFLNKLFKYISFSLILLSSGLFILADWIIAVFVGNVNPEASLLLRIISFALLFYGMSVPISQKILVFYDKKVFSLILLLVVIFNVSLNFILVPIHSAKGTAITLLLTEFFFLILTILYVKYKSCS